ncbi:hypothetical protein J4414_04010 [Candidatus Woesearchaeota archaeon]|nr:hypothetical protein [Candidatus Woesearchaeota archaeon]
MTQPIKKCRISNWEGVVWDNKKKLSNGVEVGYKTVTVSRGYKKKDEDIWRSEVINNIRLNDIPKLKTILDKLQEFLYFEAREQERLRNNDGRNKKREDFR